MRSFRMADADLAALAAGNPRPGTLDLLCRAQVSRHLLMLRQLGGPPSWFDPALPADPMAMLHTAATLRGAAPAARIMSPHALTLTHAGLTLRVRIEDRDPLRARLGLTPTAELTPADLDSWRHHLDEAWRLLAHRHPTEAAIMARTLSVIVPVIPDPGSAGISATSADAFGAVAISPPTDPVSLAVGLLHECRHSVLNALRVLFDLVVPGPPDGYSPWRDDPRPAFGILHGAYAYQAVTRFWRTEVTHGRGGPLATFEYVRWREAVLAALPEPEALTPAGRRFVTAMGDEMTPWRSDPVDPAPARLAAGANLDHHIRWRLRNVVVPPGFAAAVAESFRRGDPPPPPPPPVIRPAPRRQLESNPRLDLTHAYLQNGLDLDGPAADVAHITGDPSAADLYLRELAVNPITPAVTLRDLSIWGGLALTLPDPILRERPELVHATYRILRLDPRQITAHLASWRR